MCGGIAIFVRKDVRVACKARQHYAIVHTEIDGGEGIWICVHYCIPSINSIA